VAISICKDMLFLFWDDLMMFTHFHYKVRNPAYDSHISSIVYEHDYSTLADVHRNIYIQVFRLSRKLFLLWFSTITKTSLEFKKNRMYIWEAKHSRMAHFSLISVLKPLLSEFYNEQEDNELHSKRLLRSVFVAQWNR
jgi:hypothetical protein